MHAQMTSRERVNAAISHEEPDRVPLDIGGGTSSSIAVEGYEKLKQQMGVNSETKLLSKVFRIARIAPSISQQLRTDCLPLVIKPPSNWNPPESEPGTFIDIWGIKWKQIYYHSDCFYYEAVTHPLALAEIDDLDQYPWPDPLDTGFTRGLKEDASEMHEDTELAIVADGGFKSFWELGYLLRGYDRLLMDVMIQPEFVWALLSKLLEINLAGTGKFLDAVGKYIQVFRTADDMATQSGLLISPAAYRALIKPIYKRYYDFVKSKTDAKIFYHSCGNVVDLLDDLIEIGLDILNPVQVSAMGDTSELKARFGDKLVFWGAVDTQHVLPKGSTREVEEEVKRRIRDLAPGGGYVAAPVHNLQPDVPPQNIIAMAKAVHRFGKYPINL